MDARRERTRCFELCTYPECIALGSDNLRCSRCKTAFYCTRIHQLNDAQRHKAECKAQAPPTPPQPQCPRTRTLSVLLFPTDSDVLRLVQTECRIDGPPGHETHHIDFPALLHTHAVTSLPVGPIEPAQPGAARTRLYLAFDDCFAVNGAPPNRAADALTRGRAHTRWAGTLLGYRAREPAMEITQFEDVGVEDGPAFAAFLAEHGAPPDGPSPSDSPPPVESDFDRLFEPLWAEQADRSRAPEDSREGFPPFPGREQPRRPRARPARERTWEEEKRALALSFTYIIMEESLRQRNEVRRIVRAETQRTVLTTVLAVLALGAGAYGAWRLVVLPALAIPGILFRASLGVVRGTLLLSWQVVQVLVVAVIVGRIITRASE